MKRHILFLVTFLLSVQAFGQKMDSIKYANGHLYFHAYGTGEPIILLTGGPGASYQQLEDVAFNLAKDYRIILLEQRGSGRSMPTPYDTSTINLGTAHADLERLLDHLKLKEAHFMGHSWGAMLAMSYATSNPARVKSLLLLDPGPFKLETAVFEKYTHNQLVRFTPEELKKKNDALKKMQTPGASKQDTATYGKWELLPAIYDRGKLDSLVGKINRGSLHPVTGGLLFQSLGKQQFDLTKSLSAFTKPVHVISGAQDPGAFVSYEIKIVRPQTKLYWINKAGHFPMYEQPDEFYRIVREIMKG